MAEKKKILYIVEAMGGGVFTYIVDLANELVNKYDMYIAYAVRKQTPKNYKDYFDKRIHNHQLRHPSIKPNTREIFFGEIKNGKNFNAIVRKLYPKQSAKQLVKMFLIKAKIIGGGMTNYGISYVVK